MNNSPDTAYNHLGTDIHVRIGHAKAEDITGNMCNRHIYILCRQGSDSFTMDGRKFHILPENIALIPIGATIEDVKFSDDFAGLTMTVSREFLLRNNPDPMWATKGYVYIREYPVVQLNLASSAKLADIIARIAREAETEDHLFRREIVGHMYQIFLYEIWDICAHEIQRRDHVSGGSSKMFSDFLELAQQNAATHRDVGFYSDKLCVTAKYLSELVKRCSGRPASYWINGYATQTIAEMLKDPDMSIAEIAYRLRFFNPPHFSRFVKRMLGQTPTEYRNSIKIK